MRRGGASAVVAKAVYTLQSLKMQNKAREKAQKLRAAASRMRFKLTKLEHKVANLGEKIKRYEERAERLDDEIVESRPPGRTPRGH